MASHNVTTALVFLTGLSPGIAGAQVSIHPRNTTPAAWERFALRVVNGTDTATVAMRIEVPGAVTILGVEPVMGWTAQIGTGTDSTPQFVEWKDGRLQRGEFREFAFLGRVMGDARRTDLVFPVTLRRETGSRLVLRPLRVAVIGRTRLSIRGVTAIAGTALGLALIALVVAIAHGTRRQE